MADQLSEEGILAAYRFRQDLFQALLFLECFHAFSQSVTYLNEELCGGGTESTTSYGLGQQIKMQTVSEVPKSRSIALPNLLYQAFE